MNKFTDHIEGLYKKPETKKVDTIVPENVEKIEAIKTDVFKRRIPIQRPTEVEPVQKPASPSLYSTLLKGLMKLSIVKKFTVPSLPALEEKLLPDSTLYLAVLEALAEVIHQSPKYDKYGQISERISVILTSLCGGLSAVEYFQKHIPGEFRPGEMRLSKIIEEKQKEVLMATCYIYIEVIKRQSFEKNVKDRVERVLNFMWSIIDVFL